jgi:hypothetical protein
MSRAIPLVLNYFLYRFVHTCKRGARQSDNPFKWLKSLEDGKRRPVQISLPYRNWRADAQPSLQAVYELT